MRVAQSKNQLARIAVDIRPSNLEPAEVPLTEAAQSVLLFRHAVARTIEGGKRFFHKEGMTDGSEAVRTLGGAHVGEFFTGDEVFCNDHILLML